MHWLDPDFLPETSGTIVRFIPTPKGEMDGFVLESGQQVHLPPRLTQQAQALLHPGDLVRIRGARLRGLDVIAAVRVDTADGARLDDAGPGPGGDRPKPGGDKPKPGGNKPKHGGDKPRPPHPPGTLGHGVAVSGVAVSGVVRAALHGPRGELHGALLEDGTTVRFGPEAAQAVAALLQPGAAVALHGERIETPFGVVLKAGTVTSAGPATAGRAA